MKARCVSMAVLIVSLALMSSGASGGLVQRSNPAEIRRGLATQPQEQNVELVGQIGGVVATVAGQGSYAYVGVGPRLIILDVSDPAYPSIAGQTGMLPGVVRGVALAAADPAGRTYAYVAAGEAGLVILHLLMHPMYVPLVAKGY
jgi:hypothetical protein